jgi:HK97 family phage major capsid protein
MKIENLEGLRAVLKEALPDLVKEHPEIVLSALAGAPDALRKAFESAGMIVGTKTGDLTKEVVAGYREAQAEGIIPRGFGTRFRKPMAPFARGVWDSDLNRRTTTYLDNTSEAMASRWFMAFLSNDRRYEGKTVHEYYEELQRFATARTPATPMTIEPGTGGGYLMPTIVAAEVFEYMNERFILRNFVEVFVSANPLDIPRRTQLVTVSRFGAAQPTPEANLAGILGQVRLAPQLVGALTYVDPRLALAASVGPIRWVIGQLAEAMAKDYQRVITAGQRPIREPEGILSLPTAGGNVWDQAQTFTFTGTSPQTARDSIRSLYYQIHQPHRESNRFVWITSNQGVQTMNALNDLNQQPFKDAVNGQPATYMGKTIVETTAISVAGGSPPTTTLACGDMGQYGWLESPDGLMLQQTDIGGDAFVTNTIAVKVVQSCDGAPIIPNAFGQMTGVGFV